MAHCVIDGYSSAIDASVKPTSTASARSLTAAANNRPSVVKRNFAPLSEQSLGEKIWTRARDLETSSLTVDRLLGWLLTSASRTRANNGEPQGR